MSLATVLCTAALAPGEQALAWDDWMRGQFLGLRSELHGAGQFDGRLETHTTGALVLTHLRADRHGVVRHTALDGSSDAGWVKLVIPTRSGTTVRQQGRETRLAPGCWVIYDTAQPYRIDNTGPSNHLIAMLPRDRVARGLNLRALVARDVGADHGIARVMTDTLRSTWRQLPHMSVTAAHAAAEAVIQLVHLSLLELAGQSSEASHHAQLRDRSRALIDAHLRDPALDVSFLAEQLNCSKRLLHAAHAGSAETLAVMIQRRRLEACMRDLRAPALAERTVTEIALSWGFNNASHFSRIFRAHAGMTPGAWRSTAQPPQAGATALTDAGPRDRLAPLSRPNGAGTPPHLEPFHEHCPAPVSQCSPPRQRC